MNSIAVGKQPWSEPKVNLVLTELQTSSRQVSYFRDLSTFLGRLKCAKLLAGHRKLQPAEAAAHSDQIVLGAVQLERYGVIINNPMFTPDTSNAYIFLPPTSPSPLESYTTNEEACRSRASLVESFDGKPRLFVLTDIGNEPDDQMSLTRLLLYSNEIDLEGLVATTSCWQRDKVSPEIIKKVLSNYGRIRSNLLTHAKDFPTLGLSARFGEIGSAGIRYVRRGQRHTYTRRSIVD